MAVHVARMEEDRNFFLILTHKSTEDTNIKGKPGKIKWLKIC